MNTDSLIHIIDSLKHGEVLINNIIPTKSWLEIYAPYLTAIITLFVLIITIRANRKQMREDNLIKLRKEWIQDFSNLASKINLELFHLNLIANKNKVNISIADSVKISMEFDVHYHNMFLYRSELLMKITLEGEKFNDVYNFLDQVTTNLTLHSVGIFSTNEELLKSQKEAMRGLAEFQVIAISIIEEQNNLLAGRKND